MARPAHGRETNHSRRVHRHCRHPGRSEAELIQRVHPGKSLCVISDQWTRVALAERVFRALQPLGNVKEFVWERPRITPEGLDELMAGAGEAQALIVIGSGTVNASVRLWGRVDTRGKIGRRTETWVSVSGR